jgi:hypothetical protein
MNPDARAKPIKPVAASDIYTALLAIAFSAVFVTALFVAFKCYSRFSSLFSIP